mmetsp:Transcript_34893/g.68690  ORF Transcript_34893/g.68690 Transcript_34893/m.68690 type:complete len:143 (+) Transcript_34893:122-550(+)|eukprot:CAMPEP_0194322876 /NCGR_PEP_ID=MMETSP0171-20130528/22758_1 /TAXON_ID=218684 /ORGANISM="Corethron pennatum, Strain L29A3" /LENGTH=142 /DNA_ID=CAMNT_0039081299 /DNA_START=70 /DNA_END=498 /DNA_ORIENTATION=+
MSADISVKSMFEAMDRAVRGPSSKTLRRKFKGTITFVVRTGPDDGQVEIYYLDLAPSTAQPSCIAVDAIKEGSDMVATISAHDLVQLARGKTTAQRSFMDGKLKVKGKMGLAMKFNIILGATRKELEQNMNNKAPQSIRSKL